MRFSNCDPAGIAYFPSYIDMLVGVTEDFFTDIGAPWTTLIHERRIGVPTVRLDVTFAKPAFHGDRLDFTLRVVGIGRSSLDFAHHVAVGGDTVWTASQRLVATSLKNHRPIAWPDDIRTTLSHHLEVNDAQGPAT
nr:thioesterase family protein [Pseudochelatococcus lubricantis]